VFPYWILKVVELAAKLTEKAAMGDDASAINWIGGEEPISKFPEATARTLNRLYREPPTQG
jgi:hypothetical protein